MPAKCRPFVGQRFEAHDFAGRTVRLLIIDIDQTDQIIELILSRAHGRFPGGAFVQLTIRHGVVDEGWIFFMLQAERNADTNGQTLTQRTP